VSHFIVIPARWQSSRFPGKPLADLGGTPVLVHVWKRCRLAMDDDRIIVATDDDRIADVMNAVGARVAMTSSTCLTGTDRVAEVARTFSADWYVNVQGDEPFVDPQAIVAMMNAADKATADIAAINAMSPIILESDFRSSTVPKVVCDVRKRLLYVSRAAIATDKSLAFRTAHRQIGLYAFRQSVLEAFAAQGSKMPLEEIEDIEILRLVELGYTIQMIEVDSPGPAIDTPEDLERAIALLHHS
jgi:3-deoxy-manno-octulosonate cytidylyltransferase (CMP-KDO synthetase)